MRRFLFAFYIALLIAAPQVLRASGGIYISIPADTSQLDHKDTSQTVATSTNMAPWIAANQKRNYAVTPTPVVEKKSFLKETKELIESLSTLQYKYAMMLNVNVESLKNTALLGFMDDWFGTKYRYGGTTKRGIDCSALMENLLSKVYGLVVPRTAREQYKVSEPVKKNELEEGDLVFFKTRGKRSYVSHVGLYLKNGFFLHASSSQGVTISNLDETYFSRRFIGGGRVSGE